MRVGTALEIGSYTVTASYSGSGAFDTSVSAKITWKVTKETAKAALAVNLTTVTYGKEKTLVVTVTVTAQYSGTPAGTVTVKAGSVTLCKNVTLAKGKATCSPVSSTTLPVGSYSITAAYPGNSDYTAGTSPLRPSRCSSHDTPKRDYENLRISVHAYMHALGLRDTSAAGRQAATRTPPLSDSGDWAAVLEVDELAVP